MKSSTFLVLIGLAVCLASCQKENHAPQFAGTYLGTYTSPTDTFTGNMYATVSSKDHVKISVLDSGGATSITIDSVYIGTDEKEGTYSFMNIISTDNYHAFGVFYYKAHMVTLYCSYGNGGTSNWSTHFVGSKQ